MRLRKDGMATRKRILQAACQVFGEKGFRDATHEEICKRAGTNIAAVNYHFGDKETLYVEAWRLAFQRSLKAHPPDGEVPPDASAEERLRGRVFAIMQRIIDPQSYEFDIVHKELANPTGLLAEVMKASIEPIQRHMASIVRELLGEKAPEQQVFLCEMSIMSQCFHPMIHQRHHKALPQGPQSSCPPPLDMDIDILADHVTRFSLAGIREIRRRLENGDLAELERHDDI